jgi:hypothetical protein
MNQKDHIKTDLLLLGFTIPPVHKLMDDLQALIQYGPSHRIVRHNRDFLYWLRATYGKAVFDIALLHVLIDLDILTEKEKLKKILK